MKVKMFLRKARVALTPRNWLLKTKLSNGAMVCGKNRPGYGGRGIYVYRDALEPEFEHLLELLTPGGVFVDIGANTGIYTMKSAKFLAANGGTVVSLEPFPEMLAMLNHNVQLNGFNNVRLRNFCAGERTEVAAFWRNFEKPHAFSLTRQDDNATSFSVLVVALDDMFGWENLTRLDYLKLDAEGAEQQIISGARKTIEQYRPIIQVEINLKDLKVNLPNYSSFQATADSVNRLLIPNESPKLSVPKKLGWINVSPQK